MSNLVNEILLRLAKAGAAPARASSSTSSSSDRFGDPAIGRAALLSWLSGAAFILLVETSPI